MQKAIDRTKINVKNQKKFKGKLILVATAEDEGLGRESPDVERIFLILSINKNVRASIKTNIKPFNATYNTEEEENLFY